MVTISDIAKVCGVSPATVSKALNGALDISQETAKRIRDTAASLGYLPNATARALKLGRSYNIGVLFSDATGGGISHEYFSRILNSVKEEAERLGYDITFISKDLGFRFHVFRGSKSGYVLHCHLIVDLYFDNSRFFDLIQSVSSLDHGDRALISQSVY